MFWGKIRQYGWLLLWCLSLVTIAPAPARGIISGQEGGKVTIPLCPPQSTLEMQVTSPKAKEPALTFSFGETKPRLNVISDGSGAVGSLGGSSPELTTQFRLTPTSELRVSFLYNQEQSPGQSPLTPASHLLFRYSMDYCIMPHLRVGLSGYLYKPTSPSYAWRGTPLTDPSFGFGPGIQYDLGRWSFLLRTQLEPGQKDRSEALHNWFRVWYAF